jgi:hypothetical protein
LNGRALQAHYGPSITRKRSRRPTDDARIKRAIEQRGLVSLANATKWRELEDGIAEALAGRTFLFRFKLVTDAPHPWDWEFPLPRMLGVEWLDIHCQDRIPTRSRGQQETYDGRREPKVTVIDHSPRVAALLSRIGLEFEVGATTIRVFGYAPKNMEFFEQPTPDREPSYTPHYASRRQRRRLLVAMQEPKPVRKR